MVIVYPCTDAPNASISYIDDYRDFHDSDVYDAGTGFDCPRDDRFITT